MVVEFFISIKILIYHQSLPEALTKILNSHLSNIPTSLRHQLILNFSSLYQRHCPNSGLQSMNFLISFKILIFHKSLPEALSKILKSSFKPSNFSKTQINLRNHQSQSEALSKFWIKVVQILISIKFLIYHQSLPEALSKNLTSHLSNLPTSPRHKLI